MTDAFVDSDATWVGYLELADALRADVVIESDRHPACWARVLVRLHHEPLGFVKVASRRGAVDVDLLRGTVWRSFEKDICNHLSEDGLPRPDDLPLEGLGGWDVCAMRRPSPDQPELPLSVVVCTKDRPDSLRRVLRTLQLVQYGAFEVLVVDNAPSSSATRECVEEFAAADARIRYLLEARTGLSRARNTGLANCPLRMGGVHRRRRDRRSVVVTRRGAWNSAGRRGRVRDWDRATCHACRAFTTILR